MASRTQQKAGIEHSIAREFIALVCFALATLAVLSLVSYDPQDDTLLNRVSPAGETRNYIGPFGANVSDLLFHVFGLAAYCAPVMLFVAGCCLILRLAIPSPVTKAVGIPGLFLGSMILLTIALPDYFPGGVPAGGVSGKLVVSYLETAFSEPAAIVLGSLILAVSVLLTTHFSFGRFFLRLAGMASGVAAVIKKAGVRRSPKPRRAKKGAPALVSIRVNLGFPFGRNKHKETVNPAGPEQPGAAAKPAVASVPTAPIGQADEEESFIPVVKPPKRRPAAAASFAQDGLPPTSLLDAPISSGGKLNLKRLSEQARIIVERYREFGVEGEVLQTNPGPVVNTFEFRPAAGVKYSQVVRLGDELCLALRAVSVRINRIAGKSTIGIEVPNDNRELIGLRELIESPEFQSSASPLTIALGKQINGEPFVTRLDQMPHLLIAGATGTGKSVALNAMICSILFKAPAEVVKFILIDPKQVELCLYNGIPHLLTPVVTQPKVAANALRWACVEMEGRYQKLASRGARNLAQYNRAVAQEALRGGASSEGESEAEEPLPHIVIIIDELSDLLMAASVDVEESICRLAQKARAVGIHLIVATQRPSVNVLTGVIKANFQCRIAFRVATKVDSRTILDVNGAESLLGDGDMLFLPPRTARLVRLHGPFISEEETERVVAFMTAGAERERPEGDDDLFSLSERESLIDESLAPERDPLFGEAVNLVLATGVASISNLQRKMRLGYARAARIIDQMEQQGIVGPADGSKPRDILKKQTG